MPVDRPSPILRRLQQLRGWEGINVLLMPAIFVWIWLRHGGAVAWQLRAPSLAMVSFVLVQGTLYWQLKLQSVRDRAPLPAWFCRVFRTLRASSLAGFALVICAALFNWFRGDGRLADLAWAGALLAFAALEHVNYYHWQLKHDSAADWAYLRRYRRLRRAPLAVDLARSCAVGRQR